MTVWEEVVNSRSRAAAAALVAASLTASPASAEYPERTVDLVIPYPAGGGIDLLLRALGEGFATHFKQSFVVSNRTGAGGAIGINYVARSARTATRCCSYPLLPIRYCR